jgi:hypothetical protein
MMKPAQATTASPTAARGTRHEASNDPLFDVSTVHSNLLGCRAKGDPIAKCVA